MNRQLTQEERLDLLAEEFKAETYDYKDLVIPNDT